MEILETAAGDAAILCVSGRVNSVNATELEERVVALLARGARALVADLSRLDHLTSAGFRSLLRAERHVDTAGGTLVICGLTGLTLELFELGGFLDMFAVVGTRDEAVRRASAVVAQP